MSLPAVNANRIHGLDAMRAAMMSLGLVIHAAISYLPTPANADWPFRDPTAAPFLLHLAMFIHVFRMPAFYLVAGFFTALLLERQSVKSFVQNRSKRILLPLLVGWPLLYPLTYLGFGYANTGQWALHAEQFDITWQTPGVLIHLWFLYFLVWMYAATLVARRVAARLPGLATMLTRLATSALKSRWRLLILSAPTALLVFPSGHLSTPMSLQPDLRILAAYSYCFFVGWHLYKLRDELSSLLRAWPVYLMVGMLAAACNHYGIVQLRGGNRELVWMLTASGGAALACWGVVLGTLGGFLRLVAKRSDLLDYLVDAAYWVYLIHVPIVTITVALLKPLAWSGYGKFGLVVLVAAAASLITYEFFVRYSFIGAVLHGQRQRSTPLITRPVVGGIEGSPR
jgi:fucose 4-O-acetylase-like acetyltransferase